MCVCKCVDARVDIDKNKIILYNLISSPSNISGLTIFHGMDLKIIYPILSLGIWVSSNSFNINVIMINIH